MRMLLVIACIAALGATDGGPYAPVEGDLVVQPFPLSPLTKAIESCTATTYSHCGIVVFKDGKPFVLEAVGPVKETAYASWIAHGRNSRFVALRLKPELAGRIPEFVGAARRYVGRPYDIHMDMDDAKIYCSELLYKAFKEVYKADLGKVQKLGDLNWKPSEKFIRTIEDGGLPLERVMITPAAIVESDKATVVFTNY